MLVLIYAQNAICWKSQYYKWPFWSVMRLLDIFKSTLELASEEGGPLSTWMAKSTERLQSLGNFLKFFWWGILQWSATFWPHLQPSFSGARAKTLFLEDQVEQLIPWPCLWWASSFSGQFPVQLSIAALFECNCLQKISERNWGLDSTPSLAPCFCRTKFEL